MVVVDFPQASACVETLVDVQLVSHGQQLTALSLIQSLLSNTGIHLEFNGRIPESTRAVLVDSVCDSIGHMQQALQPLLRQTTFDLLVVGAEIDEVSETLWLWLDDPYDPL